MNTQNYASLEASKRLHDAGIVLKTESCQRYGLDDKWSLVSVDWATTMMSNTLKVIPAPSMVEVWRELPECITKGGTIQYLEMGKTGSKTYAAYDFADDYILFDNPTDALIDLLIWVKEQNKDRIVNKLLDRADKLKW